MARRTQQQLYLPNEIMELILLKLPVKSLLTFQTLSKSYMAMIKHPSFIRTHLKQSGKNHSHPNNSFLLCPKDEKVYYCLAKFEDQMFRPEKEVGNLPVLSPNFGPLCSCNDTVLFVWMTLDRNGEYLLWNPINNDHRVIQSPFCEILWNEGLCHDQIEDDYKIVLIFCDGTYTVHSCRHGTWTPKKRLDELLSREFHGGCSGVLIDGKLYWISFTATDLGIIYFDPTHDSLNELESPKDDFDLGCSPLLVNLRGHVCLCGCLKVKDVIQFWMLQEGGSWEKTILIDKRSNHLTGYLYQCYAIEDEIVIFSEGETYIIYNTLEGRLVKCSRTPLVDWENPPLPLVLSLASFLTPTPLDS